MRKGEGWKVYFLIMLLLIFAEVAWIQATGGFFRGTMLKPADGYVDYQVR